MDADFITLNSENIAAEHICCAFSDKKCTAGYELKKAWLQREFENGYIFRRIDARAKVFIEYGPAETGPAPVNAPNYLLINCLWVSGQYKGKGYAKELLQSAADDAARQGKNGLVTVVGTKKLHFMGDTQWFLKQGFTVCAKLPYGFSLLVLKTNRGAADPEFNDCVLKGECPDKDGITVYYSNRCPFTEYYVNDMLPAIAEKRNIPVKIIKLDTIQQMQSAPAPATIFSLFRNGKFVTTDLSVCTEGKFDKIVK